MPICQPNISSRCRQCITITDTGRMLKRLRKDALRTKYISIIIIMAIMAAAIGGALAVRTYIMRKRRARVNEIKEYERSISELKKARRELDILTENRQTRMEV